MPLPHPVEERFIPIDEAEALVVANRHLREGEERIRCLTEVRNRQAQASQDTAEVDRLLALLRDTLATWYQHRANILRALAREEEARMMHRWTPP